MAWVAVALLTACKKDAPAPKGDDKQEEKAEPERAKTSSDKPPAATDVATFTKHYPAVGDRDTSKRVVDIALKGSLLAKKGKPHDVDYVESTVTEKTEECLQVEGRACIKVKVSYKLDEKTTREGAKKGETKREPYSGKSYVVVRGKTAEITTVDGKAVPRDEAAALKKVYAKPDQNARMLDALPDKVKVGDDLVEFAKVFGDSATESDDVAGTPKTTCKVTVKEIKQVDGKTIVVLFVDLSSEADYMGTGLMTIGMKGTLDVAAESGMLLAADTSGPVSITFKDGGGKLTGTMHDESKTSALVLGK